MLSNGVSFSVHEPITAADLRRIKGEAQEVSSPAQKNAPSMLKPIEEDTVEITKANNPIDEDEEENNSSNAGVAAAIAGVIALTAGIAYAAKKGKLPTIENKAEIMEKAKDFCKNAKDKFSEKFPKVSEKLGLTKQEAATNENIVKRTLKKYSADNGTLRKVSK